MRFIALLVKLPRMDLRTQCPRFGQDVRKSVVFLKKIIFMSLFKPICIKIHCQNYNESVFLYHLKTDASIFEIEFECARAIRNKWLYPEHLSFSIELVDVLPTRLTDLEIIDY